MMKLGSALQVGWWTDTTGWYVGNSRKASLFSNWGRQESDTYPRIHSTDIQLLFLNSTGLCDFTISKLFSWHSGFLSSLSISFFHQVSVVIHSATSDCTHPSKSPCGESITIFHQVCSSTERLWWPSAPAAIPGMWIRLLVTDTSPSCTSQRCRQRTWGRANATFHMQGGKGVLWKWNFGTDVNECLYTHNTHTHTLTVCVHVNVYVSMLMSIMLHILPLRQTCISAKQSFFSLVLMWNLYNVFWLVWLTQSVALRCQVWRTSTQPCLLLFFRVGSRHKSFMLRLHPSILFYFFFSRAHREVLKKLLGRTGAVAPTNVVDGERETEIYRQRRRETGGGG